MGTRSFLRCVLIPGSKELSRFAVLCALDHKVLSSRQPKTKQALPPEGTLLNQVSEYALSPVKIAYISHHTHQAHQLIPLF